MSSSVVSRKYGGALAELAVAANLGEAVAAELAAVQKMLADNSELSDVVFSPAVAIASRRAILRQVVERMGVGDLTRNLLLVMLDNHRLEYLADVVESYRQALDQGLGIQSGNVVSSRALDEDDRRRLTDKLSKLTGKKMKLSFSSDPELIGGLKVQIGSTIYDGSIRTQLQEIGKRLTQR